MSVVFRLTTAAAAVALAFPLSSSAAEQGDKELSPVVVTATRQPTRINEQLSDITVIDREQIEQAGQSSLAELLGRQPGVEFNTTGGLGTSTSVFIRGGSSKQTVVLIDGLRVGSATTNDVSFSRIPLAQIERIEILRGPSSSLYGADAIGGVIQIFTKRGEGPARFNASVGYGTYNTHEETAGVRGGTETVSYSLQAANYATDGFSALVNPVNTSYNSDNDGYRNSSLTGNFSIKPAAGHELGVNVLYSIGTSRYDSSGTGTPRTSDFVNNQSLTNYSVYSRNTLSDIWTSTVRIGRATDDSKTGSTLKALPQFRTDQTLVSWQNDIRLPIGQALLAAESLKQEITATNVFPVTQRTIRSVLAGWNGNLGAHRFQANARRDDNSQFGAKTTGSLGYGYQLTTELRAGASVGTAFRAPTFNDLYFPSQSNPNLAPERARNRELSLNWERSQERAGAVYYDNRVNDMITFVGSPSLPVNISRARLSGWTFTYGNVFAGTRIDASFDKAKHRDLDTQLRLNRRADDQFKLSASRDIFGWLAGAEWQAVGDRFDDTANTKLMGGYTLVNIYGEKKIDREWTFFGRVNNLFDKKYELARDYGTPGANIFVGLRYNTQ